jgi:hypothetical protein
MTLTITLGLCSRRTCLNAKALGAVSPKTIDAVLRTLRTGVPRCDKGFWEALLEVFIDDLDYEWLMIDANHAKVHPDATRGEAEAIRAMHRNYDSKAIAQQAQRQGMEVVTSPPKNRKRPRSCDKYLCRYRGGKRFFAFQALEKHRHALYQES